jgi:hypothetical protein
MPFGGNPYQLAFALLIGIACALLTTRSAKDAAAFAAKAVFVAGGAYMLFSESRWWPAGWRVVALASWVVTGSLVAWLGYLAASQLRLLLRKR